MGMASPTDKELKMPKYRRRSREERVVLSIAKKVNEVDLSKNDLMIETGVIEESFSMMSPEKFVFSPTSMGLDAMNQGNLLWTPKTPCAEVYESESTLEALLMDLLVLPGDVENHDTAYN
ncbi:hypothetical protein Ancab_026628 [Ancistrocladus abbreviatus]